MTPVSEQVAAYRAAGFRVVPLAAGVKKAARSGWGRAFPGATWGPEDFQDGEWPGILCGPLDDGSATLIGLDRDGEISWSELEAHLGVQLPPTLSSKGDRHRYYLVPGPLDLTQSNHFFGTSAGHFDTRPTAGGLMAEKWEWDGGFDPDRIALLEPGGRVVDALRRRTPPRSDVEPTEREPSSLQLSEHDSEVVANLAAVWQDGASGDRALGGLGGFLFRCGVSWERAQGIAEKLAEVTHSSHPDPVGRVAQAYDLQHTLGLRALQEALCESADPQFVAGCVNNVCSLIQSSVDRQPAPEPVIEEPAPAPEVSELELIRSKIVDLAGDCNDVLETPPWICEGLALARGVRPATFVAYAGVGKTTALSSLAVAVATGGKALGFAPCVQGRVLIIDHEDSFGYRRSIQEICRAAKQPAPSIDYLDGEITLRDERRLPLLPELFAPYDLIICDSLGAMNAGLDENSTAYADIFRDLYRLCKTCRPGGTCLVFARHTGKNNRDDAGAGRGSSAIDGWTSTQWLLTRVDKDDWAQGVKWNCIRMNGVNLRKPPAPFISGYSERAGFAYQPAAVGRVVDLQVENRVLATLRELRRAEPDRWVTTSDVRAVVTGKACDVGDALKRLAHAGKLEYKQSGRSSLYRAWGV